MKNNWLCFLFLKQKILTNNLNMDRQSMIDP